MSVIQIYSLPDIGLYTEDYVLRKKSRELSPDELSEGWFKQLIFDMYETLYTIPDGTGMAAPQVGFPIRVVVIDVEMDGSDPIVLVNPIYVPDGDETFPIRETCLSLPRFAGEVTRHSRVIVKALDQHGRPVELTGEGLLSSVFQHEIDHLDGILYIDLMDDIESLEETTYHSELAAKALQNLKL